MPFGAFLPKEYSFFDFFQQHAAKCVEASKLLFEMLAEFNNVEERAKAIKRVETDADTITHTTVETLHKTFITPLDRDEIYRLISRMDDIVDLIEAASERLILYDLKAIQPEAQELAKNLVRATEQIERAVAELRTLKRPMDILKCCVEINRIENESDSVLRKAMARLFKDAHDALDVIKWKDIYEILEAASDRCEDVANVIEGVVLEHA